MFSNIFLRFENNDENFGSSFNTLWFIWLFARSCLQCYHFIEPSFFLYLHALGELTHMAMNGLLIICSVYALSSLAFMYCYVYILMSRSWIRFLFVIR